MQFWTVSYNETSEKPTDSIKTADIVTDCRHKLRPDRETEIRSVTGYWLLSCCFVFSNKWVTDVFAIALRAKPFLYILF